MIATSGPRVTKLAGFSVALILVATVACGGGEKKTTEPRLTGDPAPTETATGSPDDFGAKVSAWMKSVIKIIEANKGDCSALGEKLNDNATANAELLRKMLATTSSIEAKAWKDENTELVEQFNGSWKNVAAKCVNDPKMQEFAKTMSSFAGK